MNIQQSTIIAYTFTLSESELRAAILDPHPLLGQFKLALNGGVQGAESRQIVPSNDKGSHFKPGRKRLPKGGRPPGSKANGLLKYPAFHYRDLALFGVPERIQKPEAARQPHRRKTPTGDDSITNLNPRLPGERIVCPKCGQKLEQRDLNRHRKDCHAPD